MKKAKATLIILACIATFAGTAIAGSVKVTKEGYFASFSQETFDRAVSVLSSGDNAALVKMFENNEIFMLHGGVKVYLEEVRWSGMIRIRPDGQPFSVWTFSEAVE